MKRWIKSGAAILLSTVVMAGCTFGGGGQAGQWDQEEKATIRVMYYDERSFYQTYGNLFYAKYPNIDIEVVSTQGIYKPDTDYREEFAKFIEEEQPDILMLTSDQYEKYAEEGYLYDLESYIQQSNFDLEGILPAGIDYLKIKGGGKLYGLSPTFSGRALYYNKDLFDQHGVSFPQDQMSWDEVFDLAKRFAGLEKDGKPVYGLSLGNYTTLEYVVSTIGNTMRQTYVNPDTMTVTIDTEGWNHIVTSAVDLFQSGALHQEERDSGPRSFYTMEDFYKEQVFIDGRAAMSLDYHYMLGELAQAKTVLKDKMPEWDVVTMPVDPSQPDVSSSFSADQIFAINAKSGNTRAAWELIKYISGDEYARVMSKSGTERGLLARTEYIKNEEGRNIEAFYKLKPEETSLYKNYDKLPENFLMTFNEWIQEELDLVAKNEKSVAEALATIQDKGQAELNRTKEEGS